MRRQWKRRAMRPNQGRRTRWPLLAVVLAVAVMAAWEAPGQARQVAAPAPVAPIVVRDLRFLGFGKDVVGRGWSARPNGERDAHFSVVLAAPKGARSWAGDLSLLECGVGSQPAPDPSDPLKQSKCDNGRGLYPDRFASTRRVAPAAIVAVFRGGKRLRIDPGAKKTWLRLPRSATGVRLDLYVNDGPGCAKAPGAAKTAVVCLPGKRIDHRFAAGQMFSVMTEAGADKYYGAWTKVPGQTATDSTPYVVVGNLRFHGLDRDVLGATPGSPPDGKLDGHFSVEITTPTGPGYLRDVNLGLTQDAVQGTLAVFLGNRRLKFDSGDPQTWLDLRWLSEPVRLDLYATDEASGPFAPGKRVQATADVSPPASYVGQGGSSVGKSDWLTLPSG
jgi:hypothetical protein